MNWLVNLLAKMRLFQGEFDNHLVRASMVIVYFFFGYQKWFDYEAQGLIPFFTHGPLIFWMYPVFGMKGSTYLLGISEWLFGALLLAGFWNKKLGVFGALGSVVTFLCTVTIIPFMPDGWAASAGGFPAMVGNVAFLMKDVFCWRCRYICSNMTLSERPLRQTFSLCRRPLHGEAMHAL